jgi:alkylation response protein AidB-like acyl-CoA dehydrogenase
LPRGHLLRLCTPEQKERWFPGYCGGDLITAIAMTEPGAGSDLQGIRTTAVRDGDYYILNGQKTFITNGQLADLVIVVARTNPDLGHKGIRLLMVERGMPGSSVAATWTRSACTCRTRLSCSSPTSACRPPTCSASKAAASSPSLQNLPRERVTIGVYALAVAEQAYEDTLRYTKERKAFGQPIGSFQHSKFVLTEMATELAVARAFTDKAIMVHVQDQLTTQEASMVKWWNTELCNRVTDRCTAASTTRPLASGSCMCCSTSVGIRSAFAVRTAVRSGSPTTVRKASVGRAGPPVPSAAPRRTRSRPGSRAGTRPT